MNDFGISAEEIDKILDEAGIKDGDIASATGTRKAIAKAIIANNNALLPAIEKIATESAHAVLKDFLEDVAREV